MQLKQSSSTLILILQALFGAAFIFSGITKLVDLSSFEEALINFKLISDNLVHFVKYLVPFIEIILGVGIIFNFNSSIPSFLASLVLSFFTALIIAKIFEGEEISCGCFGALSSDKLDEYSILRNVLLLIVAIIISVYYENRKIKKDKVSKEVYKHKALNLIFIANLIFYLTTQNFIFALQNNGLKSRLALLINDYDILKEGDDDVPFKLYTGTNEIINIDYEDSNKKTLLYILKPGCSPCKTNLPNWNYLNERINISNARVIPISIDEAENTIKYVNDNSIPFKVYSNNTDNFILNYKTFLTPQTILINDSGKVIKNWKGILTEDALIEILSNI
jgi:uncharacterized membrane protein YphA (DoxX/SURF4 family)/peroxiredoxin